MPPQSLWDPDDKCHYIPPFLFTVLYFRFSWVDSQMRCLQWSEGITSRNRKKSHNQNHGQIKKTCIWARTIPWVNISDKTLSSFHKDKGREGVSTFRFAKFGYSNLIIKVVACMFFCFLVWRADNFLDYFPFHLMHCRWWAFLNSCLI